MNLKAPVSSLMAVDILTAGRGTPAKILCERFRSTGLHHLPVVDEEGILLGIISHVDLFKAADDDDDMPAGELMHEVPAVIHPDDPIAVAVAVLAGGVFHALPVVDEEGGLCGLLTTSDLLRGMLNEHGRELYGADVPDLSDDPAPCGLDDATRLDHYDAVRTRLDALLAGETDWIAAMATVACELHHAFCYFDWTGFYRVVDEGVLAVGPYQGGHGCLSIDFDRGVCGAAARTRQTQLVPDVRAFPGYIACTEATRSELVVPIITPDRRLLGVLDVDSDTPDAFTEADRVALEAICGELGVRFAAA